MDTPAARLVAAWQEARKALVAIEIAEHPDLLDERARRWRWWKGDLYRYRSSAIPRAFFRRDATEVPHRSIARALSRHRGLQFATARNQRDRLPLLRFNAQR